MKRIGIVALVTLGPLAGGGGAAKRPPSTLPSPTAGRQAAAIQPSVVGVWRLVRWCDVDSTGRENYRLGEHPVGYFVYLPTGQLSLHAMRTPPVPPFAAGDFSPTGPEGQALIASYFGYFGTYTITSDSTVVHHVVGGSIPSYVGTDQHRHYRIQRGTAGQPDTLSIGDYPAPRCRKLVRVG